MLSSNNFFPSWPFPAAVGLIGSLALSSREGNSCPAECVGRAGGRRTAAPGASCATAQQRAGVFAGAVSPACHLPWPGLHRFLVTSAMLWL